MSHAHGRCELEEGFPSDDEGNMSPCTQGGRYSPFSASGTTPPPPHPLHHNHAPNNPFDGSATLMDLLMVPPSLRHCTETNSSSFDVEGGNIAPMAFPDHSIRTGSPDRNDEGVFLTWEDLWVTVPGGRGIGGWRAILEGSTGYAQPGRVLAIMGPSGCGKSTLLDALAGRLASNTRQSGHILVNGRRQPLSFGTSAYVTQDDILMTTLTVREAVYYSAQLQLPDSMTKSQKRDRADATIKEMGLEDAMDTRIGGMSSKGLSGGQKRRVSICLEILMRPRLLFLDEPTSGLDSAASFHVMNWIARLARHNRRTIVVSIHQPSSEVFELFDYLYLLTCGKTIYFGPASETTEFFAVNGFPCPPLKNPADHFLRTINKNFGEITEGDNGVSPLSTTEVINILVRSYESSIHRGQVEKRVAEITNRKGANLKSGGQASLINQCIVLTMRSAVNMYRDVGYYWLRFIIYLGIAFCLGGIFYKLNLSYASILERRAILMFIGGFLTFMTIGRFPSFVEDMKVFERERLNGHYGVAAYVISHTISSIPFLIVVSVIPGIVTYFMVEFQRTFGHFAYFALVLYMLITLVESLMMMVASIVPNFLLGIITGAGIQGMMLLTSGFFKLPEYMPKILWKYPLLYISFHKWGIEGFCKNEFYGLNFPNSDGPEPKTITGFEVVRDVFKMEVGYPKWVDLAVLFGMVVAYRLLFFLIIKIKEKMLPIVRAIGSMQPKQTMHIMQQPSTPKGEANV